MAFLRNDFFRIVIEVIMTTALNVSEIVVSHSLLSAIVLVTTVEALNS
jgi:diacylglycerol kinase